MSEAAGASWRHQHGFSQADILFVCVARLQSPKNHKLLIDAFAAGPGKHPASHLLLVGDGGLRDELNNQVRLLGLEKRVHFLGWQNNIPVILSASDVSVLASDWEGNPISVMEAMAAGKPVICTAVGGVPELIEHGITGFLVAPKELVPLAQLMTDLLLDPSLRKQIGMAAVEAAQDRFDIEHMAEGYSRVYHRVMSEYRTRQVP